MAEPSKYTIHHAEVFQVIEENTGTVIGKSVTFPNPQQTEATRAVADLLQDLRRRHPQASDTELLAILQQNLETLRQSQPQKWQHWLDLFSLVFAGGIEAVKVVAPTLGIPIEVGKQLYEMVQRDRQQLPGNKVQQKVEEESQ